MCTRDTGQTRRLENKELWLGETKSAKGSEREGVAELVSPQRRGMGSQDELGEGESWGMVPVRYLQKLAGNNYLTGAGDSAGAGAGTERRPASSAKGALGWC